MLNSKLINTGAILLFLYCLYDARSFESINLGYDDNNSPKPQYSLKVNLDENSPDRTIFDKIVGYAVSRKLKQDKALSIEKEEIIVNKDPSLYLVLEGDKVSFLYVIQNVDGSNEEGFLDSFTIADDFISNSIKGAKMLEERKVVIVPDVTLPSFLENKKNAQNIVIIIKSLTKAHT